MQAFRCSFEIHWKVRSNTWLCHQLSVLGETFCKQREFKISSCPSKGKQAPWWHCTTDGSRTPTSTLRKLCVSY